MRPFIGADDLSAVLGVPVDDSELITAIALDAACTAVRTYLDQTINYVPDDLEYIDGAGRQTIRLRERPVRDITSIRVDEQFLETQVWDLRGSRIRWLGTAFPIGISNIEVVYSHGYDAVPDDSAGDDWLVPPDMRLVALGMARRVYTSVSNSAVPVGALSSETIGSYSYSQGSLPPEIVGAIASNSLLAAEERVLDRYRVGARQ